MRKFISCAVAAAMLTTVFSASLGAVAEESDLQLETAVLSNEADNSSVSVKKEESAVSEEAGTTTAENPLTEENNDSEDIETENSEPTLEERIKTALEIYEHQSERNKRIEEYKAKTAETLSKYNLPAYDEKIEFAAREEDLTIYADESEYVIFQNKVDNYEKNPNKHFDVPIVDGGYIVKFVSDDKVYDQNGNLIVDMDDFHEITSEETNQLAILEKCFIDLGRSGVHDEIITVPFQFDKPYDNYLRIDGYDIQDLPNILKSISTSDKEAEQEIYKLIYRLDYGNDIYHVVKSSEPVSAAISDTDGIDTIFFDYDVEPDDIEYIRYNNDLYLNDYKNEVFIHVQNFANKGKIENIAFNNGTILDYDDIIEYCNILCGTNDSDEIKAISGNVYAFGYDGDDIITAVSGNDFIYAGKGDDTIYTQSGDDIIYYCLGDGNDLINDDIGHNRYPYSGNDVLYLADITPDMAEARISKNGYDFIIYFPETNESITMPGNQELMLHKVFPIENIVFADGTVWDLNYLEENSYCYISGTDDDDSLNGSKYNDVVICGKGNDYFNGGEGDDRYYYEQGDGCDTLYDFSIWGSGNNKLYFGENISIDDIYYEKSNYNNKKFSRFYIKESTSYVQVSGINEIIFSDGTSITVNELIEQVKPASEMETQPLKGDLNTDGTVNAADLLLMKNYLLGSNSGVILPNSDIDDNKSVNILDMILLMDILLG